MNHFMRILLTLFVLITGTVGMAQYKCAEYHRFNGQPSSDKRFSQNGQSKSAMVQVGKETELNIIVYRGQDYRISLSHDAKVLGEDLAIRLVEKVRVPYDEVMDVTSMEDVLDAAGKKTGQQEVTTKQKRRVYEEEEKVLWDNTSSNMANSVEFSCTATKRIAVEVNARGASDAKPKKNGEPNDIGCVGILIEHMPTPPLGF